MHLSYVCRLCVSHSGLHVARQSICATDAILHVQVMHQLSGDTETCMLAADVSSPLLLASAQDPGKPTRCMAVYSLSPEAGLFKLQGRAPLPPIGSPTPSAAATNLLKPQVISAR